MNVNWLRNRPAGDKLLVLMMGLPRAGKSTLAATRPWPRVNPDSIRLALTGQPFLAQAEPMVWAVAKTMVRSLFLAGHDTVLLDATNVTFARRDEWRDPAWKTAVWEVPTPKEVCLSRTQEGDNLAAVIEWMARIYEPPSDLELRYPSEADGY